MSEPTKVEKEVTLAGIKRVVTIVVALSLITFVLSLGQVIQSEDRNDKLDRLENVVGEMQETANRTEASAKDVEDYVDELRERSENDEGVGTEELRTVFGIIVDIKNIVCSMNANSEACAPN